MADMPDDDDAVGIYYEALLPAKFGDGSSNLLYGFIRDLTRVLAVRLDQTDRGHPHFANRMSKNVFDAVHDFCQLIAPSGGRIELK